MLYSVLRVANAEEGVNTITLICNNKTQPHLKDLKIMAEILEVDIREFLVSTM